MANIRGPGSKWASLIVGVAALTLSAGVPVGAYPRPGTTEIVSVAKKGVGDCEREPSGWNAPPAISPNGRYVAFDSPHCDLVSEDRNLLSDVFLHDRVRDKTELISISSTGVQPIYPPVNPFGSFGASVSADGRYVAYESDAVNLVAGDTNLAKDVFVYDRFSGQVERVSIGILPFDSGNASISAGGRFVAFDSDAPDLVADDTNLSKDVFVHDRVTGKIERVSQSSDGHQADDFGPITGSGSECPSVSASGRYVSFGSFAEDLVEDDSNLLPDVFVHDRKAGKTERISVASDGSQTDGPPGSGVCGGSSISAKGRFVAFTSGATDLVPNDGHKAPIDVGSNADGSAADVFVHDRETGRTERVSVTSAGQEVAEGSANAFISPDGRFVAFASLANNLAPGDTGYVSEFARVMGVGDADVFVHDRMTGTTELLSVSSQGEEAGTCEDGSVVGGAPGGISNEGRFASLQSCSRNLAPPHPHGIDVFVRDRGASVRAGGLHGAAGRSRLKIAGAPFFASKLLFTLRDPDHDGVHIPGAKILGATLAYRPHLDDLYVKIDLDRIPGPRGANLAGNPALVYGTRLRAEGTNYEVRVTKTTGAGFELFRCVTWTSCNKVAQLEGGYGTGGESVVFSLPLEDIGLEGGEDIGQVTAFSALGSLHLGPTKMLDTATMG